MCGLSSVVLMPQKIVSVPVILSCRSRGKVKRFARGFVSPSPGVYLSDDIAVQYKYITVR